VKRLAVEVEDHPVSYGSFEGSIPKGEYGGGEVYQWDSGSWEPVGDAEACLRKGRLEFELKGRRLRGRWILVRTRRGSGAKPQWLLIKRHDAFAVAGDSADVIGADVKPVKTPAKKARLPAKTRAPGFLPVQLARLADLPPEGEGWIHEIKFDGYRLQVHVNGKKARIFTRSGLDWTKKFPTLAREVASFGISSCILDGEAVVLDEGGRSDFQKLQNSLELGRAGDIVFYAFDLLFLDGRDLRSLPLLQRKKALEALVKKKGRSVVRYRELLPYAARRHDLQTRRLGIHLRPRRRLDQIQVREAPGARDRRLH
jgi:bifunctional non-homologous end joining protein LigD